MSLTERLRKLRSEKNILQKDLANFLDVSTSTVGKYESGIREPNLDKLKKIANFYNVSLDYLVGRSEKKLSYSKSWYSEEFYQFLKSERNLSTEDMIRMQEDQLIDFICKSFNDKKPTVSKLKKKIQDNVNFNLKDYTDQELDKIIKLAYGIEEDKIKLFQDGNIPKNIMETIKKHANSKNNIHKIPLVSKIDSFDDFDCEDNRISYINAPSNEIQKKDYFYLIVGDNSMKDANINRKDIVLIKKQNDIKNNEIAVVWIEDKKKAIIRKVNKINIETTNKLILQEQNISGKLEIYDFSEARIIGKVLEVRKKISNSYY
ncbi:MAG: helix-turn-helix domain-containing protein [Candidatus Woesearchaeota archaeon]